MEFAWDVVGHQKETEYLQRCLKTEKLAHGYLFCGPKDLGKKKVAQCFIYSLFCSSQTHRRPCGRCQACEQISKGIHPDVFWLKMEGKSIRIEKIRDLISNLQKKSLANSYKVAVIEDAEKITLEASNALLKTLEEPPAKTIIILIAQTTDNLPLTILSRVVVLNFNLVSRKEIYNWLRRKTDIETAKILSFKAQGKPELAGEHLRNKKLAQNQDKIIEEMISLINKSTAKRLETADNKISWDDWIAIFRDMLILRFHQEQHLTNPTKQDKLKQAALRYSTERLLKIINTCRFYKKMADKNINRKLLVENLMLNI